MSEHFITDTARYADIVLPATTQMEQFEIMFSWGHFYLSLNHQAIEPRGEAVPNTELFRRLARAMGIDDRHPAAATTQMALDAMDWANPAMEGITMERLQRERLCTPEGRDARHLCAARGRQVPDAVGQGRAEGLDGRRRQLRPAAVSPGLQRVPGRQPVDPLPGFIPPQRIAGDQRALAAKYPLNLLTPKNHAFLNSGYANLPGQLHHAGEQFVLVNPKDAIARNIGEGSPVRVFNDRGSFEAIAKVSPEVMQGVVVAPLGYWRDPSRAKATVNALSPSAYADLGRAPTFSDTLVEVAIAHAAAAE